MWKEIKKWFVSRETPIKKGVCVVASVLILAVLLTFCGGCQNLSSDGSLSATQINGITNEIGSIHGGV